MICAGSGSIAGGRCYRVGLFIRPAQPERGEGF